MLEPQKSITLPAFTSEGLLPSGTYDMTVAQLRRSYLVRGYSPDNKTWDNRWRKQLVDNLGRVGAVLRLAGVTNVYVDGSFVEDKDHPNDIDVYFECVPRAWLALMPHLVQAGAAVNIPFSWDPNTRSIDPTTRAYHLPLWHALRVDLFVHYGQDSGVKSVQGYDQMFPDLFRHRRDGTEKGILKITT